MVDGEAPKNVKEADKVIDNAAKEGGITPQEIEEIKKVKDFLDQKNDPKKTKEAVDQVIESSKAKIATGITDYFKTDINTSLETKISKLSGEEIQAYINVITWLNNTALDPIKIALVDFTNKKEIKEKTDAGTEKLFKLLSAEPSKANAEKLFGDAGDEYKPAWEALFSQTAGTDFKINTEINKKTNLDVTKMEQNFQELIKIAVGINGKNVKDLKIIIPTNGGTVYNEGTKYIQVSYEIEGTKYTKDIMFGKSTDIIHQARAEHIKDGDMDKFKTEFDKGSKELLIAIDKFGAHLTLDKMINNKKITMSELLSKDFLKKVNEFYSTGEGKTEENKENQYYSKITDIVVAEAKGGNIILMKQYLQSVNAQNLKYLGTDKTAQIANYNKLVDVVQSAEFKKNINDPVNQEIYSKILALQTQLGNPTGRKEALNSGVDGFFKAYGKHIVGILERFGGKGAVKKFFSSLGMDAFYEKNLKSIEDNINKIYKEKFELSKDQKDGITDIIGKDGEEKFNKDIIDISKVNDAIDNFKTKDKNKNKETLTAELKKKIGLLDPNLVHYLITKDFSNNKEITDGNIDDGKPLNTNDFLFKDSATNQRKINDNLIKNGDNQNKLIARLFADKTTRETIKGANEKIEGIRTSSDNAKVAEFSRSDLGNLGEIGRKQYAIQSDQDIARFFTAYAFAGSKTIDYVITENNLSHNRTKPTTTPTDIPVADNKTTEKPKS